MVAGTGVNDLLSQRARNVTGIHGGGGREGVIFFSAGFPDPASLPYEGIAEATARAMRTHGQWPLQYGPAFGYEGLLDFLIGKLGRDQGIRCTRDNLLLTAGAGQALGLVCDLLLDPGDTILSEQPTWGGAIRDFQNAGVTVETVPLDGEGTRVDVLEEKLAALQRRGVGPKLLYTLPNFQNPVGVTTTLERRRRIVELAERYNLAILEDDAYFDLRFEGEQLPTLYELDGGRRVFYVGTFSKILAAGMRLGWIVGEPGLIARLAGLKVDGSTNPFAAHVAYEFCKDGTLEARVRELIANYRARRDLMLGELLERMPEGVSWSVPEGGFFIWLTLPEGLDAARMLLRARERGVEYLPGRACFFDGDGDGRRHIRLAFSYVSDEEAARGIGILSEVIGEELRHGQG